MSRKIPLSVLPLLGACVSDAGLTQPGVQRGTPGLGWRRMEEDIYKCAGKYNYEDSPHTFSFSPVTCVVLIMVIISSLLTTGYFALGYLVDASVADVDVILQISGNDVLVTVADGDAARQITSLSVQLDEYPEGQMVTKDPLIGSAMTFPEMGTGVSGYKFVIVEATFADGTTAVVDFVRMRFS